MEYRRQDGLIGAGFALNAWRLLKQYERLTQDLDPSDRCEATLTVCVLQSLLTNCWELYKYLGNKAPRMFGALDTYIESVLSEPEVKMRNTFPAPVTAREVIVHLRNALSHPRVRSDTGLSTTGYTTAEDGSGVVARFCFIDSPDVNSKGNLTDAFTKAGAYPELVRVFEIELAVSQLMRIAEEMALVLAQPVMDNWNNPDLIPLMA